MMSMPTMPAVHPTPTQAYELGVNYATILRHVFTHPEFIYQEPPNAVVAKPDLERTPIGLYFASDFLQNTYIKNVLPYLPPGATRKCKELANPWAYADSTYDWEWSWDAERGVMKDLVTGETVDFPKLSKFQVEANAVDLATRNFFARKLILENETDEKAKSMLGGRTIDFGEGARSMVQRLT